MTIKFSICRCNCNIVFFGSAKTILPAAKSTVSWPLPKKLLQKTLLSLWTAKKAIHPLSSFYFASHPTEPTGPLPAIHYPSTDFLLFHPLTFQLKSFNSPTHPVPTFNYLVVSIFLLSFQLRSAYSSLHFEFRIWNLVYLSIYIWHKSKANFALSPFTIENTACKPFITRLGKKK